MPESLIDAMLAELEAARAVLPAPSRGLTDFQKLELNGDATVVAEAKAKLSSATQFDAERAKQLTDAINVLTGLKGHGYPARDPFEVSDAVADLLDKEISELQKARARFAKRPPATGGAVEFAPEDQP